MTIELKRSEWLPQVKWTYLLYLKSSYINGEPKYWVFDHHPQSRKRFLSEEEAYEVFHTLNYHEKNEVIEVVKYPVFMEKDLANPDNKKVYILDNVYMELDEKGIGSVWEHFSIYTVLCVKIGYFKWHHTLNDYYIINTKGQEEKVFIELNGKSDFDKLSLIVKDIENRLDCFFKFPPDYESVKDIDITVYKGNKNASFDLLKGELDYWLLSYNKDKFKKIDKLIKDNRKDWDK